jgi:hypothetical protein
LSGKRKSTKQEKISALNALCRFLDGVQITKVLIRKCDDLAVHEEANKAVRIQLPVKN